MNLVMLMIEKIDTILEYTKKLSLPVFADDHTKQDIIDSEKEKIDDNIELILSENEAYMRDFWNNKEKLWEDAQTDSLEYFDNLPGRLQINSFYFQEVMHRYVEYIKEFIFNE